MIMSKKRIGIYGGTFDPIHLGHIKVAMAARLRFHLEKVIFVAARCPPHKSINDISYSEHRYAMVELAIKDIPCFESSRIELERNSHVRTHQSIDEMVPEDVRDYTLRRGLYQDKKNHLGIAA